MPSSLQIWFDRLTTTMFSSTLAFTFCGLFLLPSGKSILANMLVISILFGGINLLIGRQFNVGLREHRLLWVFIGYAGFILFNRFVHGDQYGVMRSLGYVVLFGLLIPRKPIVLKASCYAIIMGGLGMGSLSLWQQFQGINRVEGFTNAILFSQASLTIALLAWGINKEARLNIWKRAVTIFSLFMALYSLYASQSRGVWLAFIFIFGVVMAVKAFHKPRKYMAISLVLLFAGFLFYSHNSVLQERLQASISDLKYAENGAYGTSWGLRIVAWQGAWQGFLSSPILGVGTDGFDAMKQALVASGVSSPLLLAPQLTHSHSQYMQNLFIRGATGGLALLLFMGLPMWWAGRSWGWTSLGVLLPLSYAINGVSDVPFEHQETLFLFVLSLIFCFHFNDSLHINSTPKIKHNYI